MARRATVVNEQRAKASHVLLLDAGDTLVSDHWLAMDSQGEIVIAAMNLMGYDAMVLGERDLALGEDVLRQRVAQAQFSILSANLMLGGERFVDPYVIRIVGGHKVAIIGLSGALADASYGFESRDPVETARGIISGVAGQVDIVILLAHVGWAAEQELQEIEGVDVIVGGSSLARTTQARWNDGRGTLILPSEQPATGHAGRTLGLSLLRFDDGGRLTGHESQMVSLTPEIADDAAQVALIQEFLQRAIE